MPVLNKSSQFNCALLTVALVFTVAPAAFSEETTEAVSQTADFAGKAAFYSSDLHGKKTASGQAYDEGKLTAAHKHLPFGTKVTVVNRKNGKTCTLTINDRGPYTPNHVIDVSKAAAKELGLMSDNKRIVDCFIKIDAKDLLRKQQQKVKVASQPEGETL
ncbi:MAG: septal ring lytic transglycosylase RlpA family protein [Candidatus Melainabacteria bacterium]|nr:septal ring lytic transglycosylase RlpA family protein [Candidatus Melainabacteria bacterium]